MSFKVLHIIDYYLPETMQWIEDLLNTTKDEIEHHIASFYYDNRSLGFSTIVSVGMKSSYPPNMLSKAITYFNQSKYEKIILEYIKANKIDAVHFHFGHMAIKYDKLLFSLTCKSFISLYGFDYEYLPTNKPETLQYYQRFANVGSCFIVEGNYSKNLLESYQIPFNQIEIVQMFFKRTTQLNLIKLSQPILLLQVATYTEKKGQLILLEALNKSNTKNLFTINFYGEAIDKHYYKELISYKSKNYLHNVNFNNKISFPEYLRKLEKTHIAVNLSRKSKLSDTEGGCPVFLKDSLSFGKPIFTTKHCDIPDLAVSEYNGWVVEENNVYSSSQKLKQISKLDSRSYLKFCNNAFQSALPKIESNWTKECLMQVYLKKN